MANGHITVLNNSLDVWKVALYVFLKHVQSKMSKSILTCSNAFQWNFFFIFCNSAIESWCFWQICYCTILLARYFLEVLEKKETLSSSDESELGYFKFRAETELTKQAIFWPCLKMSSKFYNFVHVLLWLQPILINFTVTYINLCNTKGIFWVEYCDLAT